MLMTNIVDKLHNHNRFPNSGTTKKSDFTSFHNWCEEIDDFDSGF